MWFDLAPFEHQPSLCQIRQNTPLSQIELAELLRDTHKTVFNVYPSKQRLAMAWSQVGLENGQGKSTYNFNLGNINPTKYQQYDLYYGCKFRSYNSFEEGGIAYWEFLRRRCSYALKTFDYGQTDVSAVALKKCGYYGADLKIYQNIMGQLFNVFYKKVLPKMNLN